MLTQTKIEKNFVTGNKPLPVGCPECPPVEPEEDGLNARTANIEPEEEVVAPKGKTTTK